MLEKVYPKQYFNLIDCVPARIWIGSATKFPAFTQPVSVLEKLAYYRVGTKK